MASWQLLKPASWVVSNLLFPICSYFSSRPLGAASPRQRIVGGSTTHFCPQQTRRLLSARPTDMGTVISCWKKRTSSSSTSSATTLTTAFTACYLPYQQHHSIFILFYFIFIYFFLGRLLVLYFSLVAPAICYLFFLHVVLYVLGK